MKKGMQISGRFFVSAILVIIVALVVFSSYTIVNPGHRGVVIMLGSVEGTTLAEGFHLVIPPGVRTVVQVDVRTKKTEQTVEAASSDLQLIQVNGVLNYHLDPANVNKLYQRVGLSFEDVIIKPALQEAIKATTAGFKVEQILVSRAVIKDKIQTTLYERLGENHIIVDEFSLADVKFSAEFDAAIERKQVAEQSALQKQYELQSAQKDVEITLAKAEGERKSAVIAAEGRAAARKVEAEAEAAALALIAEQINKSPALIQYEWATKLSPTVSTIMIPSDQSLIFDAKSLVK
jgi:regulator of protease activity HflC (stomatin/prohibitin superfamily)